LKKLLALIAFSVLLLVPVGAQQVFATHPDLPCPPPGILNTNGMIFSENLNTANYCYHLPTFFDFCVAPYSVDILTNFDSSLRQFDACTVAPQQTPDPTLEAQCQGAAVLISNHCFAEALASMVGGILLSIDTTAVLVSAIGTDPVITGLVAITMAGIVGQAAWFIHRRKKKVLNS